MLPMAFRAGQMQELLAAAFERAELPGVVAAFLFGSHAQGTMHRDSDVDVGILLERGKFPDRLDRFDQRVRLTSWLIGETHCNEVDVVILNDAPPLLARHILTKGKRVFGGDDRTFQDFYRDALLRAADLEPFLRRMARIKLNALAR